MEKQQTLYSGKTKTIYKTDNDDVFVILFRNDATALNNAKHAQLMNKGKVNNLFNAFIMQKLTDAKIETHFIKVRSEMESEVRALKMFPIETIVRNLIAGTMAQRYGLDEGQLLSPPVIEFFYKSDELRDPLVNDSHIMTFQWANAAEIAEMKKISLQANEVLQPLFAKAGFCLVDFKLEFGQHANTILLGDEFSPDSCRIWDLETGEKYDKDRFRQDMGSVIEFYYEAAQRLGVPGL